MAHTLRIRAHENPLFPTRPGYPLRRPGYRTSATPATCSAATDGQIVFTAGAAGVKDSVQVCAKDATNTYALRTLY